LLRERGRERRRRGRAGDGVGEDLHGHPEAGGGDEAVAHAGAEVQRADRRVPHVEDDAAGRGFAGPGREHRLGHLEEHRSLPGVVLARAADGLVGLGGDGEVRIQRMQVGRDVARRDQAVDRVWVALLVHDPGGKDLVAERRRTGDAGARVPHRGGLAHIVHVDAARRRSDGEVPLRVARQHRVLAAATPEGGGDHGRRQQHPALQAG
jgi:hypothetical protein